MQFLYTSMITLAGFVALSQAAAIPSAEQTTSIVAAEWPTNLADGAYSVTKNEDGHFVITNSTTPIDVEALKLAARGVLPNPSVGCSHHGINDADYQIARSGLTNWCNQGHYVLGTSAQFFLYGSAQSYLCNYSQSPQPCYQTEFDEANSLVDTSCGANQAGWVMINDWAKSYGRDNSGVPECW